MNMSTRQRIAQFDAEHPTIAAQINAAKAAFGRRRMDLEPYPLPRLDPAANIRNVAIYATGEMVVTCKRFSAPCVDLFVCGSTRTACFACKRLARTSCAVKLCGKHLCEDHVRKVDGESRCATHAPMATNPDMPKPPPIRR
jgi:hypothetical protein